MNARKLLLRPVALLALAGVLCLTATAGNAAEIVVQQFVVPGDSSAIFTYTNTLMGPFTLPGEQGYYTATIPITDTLNLPTEVQITGTVDASWIQRVIISSTQPAGDTSYVVTFTLPITGTQPDAEPTAGTGYTATVVHLDVDENEDFLVTFTNTVAPEPATAVLLAASAVGLVFCRKRRRRPIG